MTFFSRLSKSLLGWEKTMEMDVDEAFSFIQLLLDIVALVDSLDMQGLQRLIHFPGECSANVVKELLIMEILEKRSLYGLR
jgi:hypothetical protein